MDFVNYRIVRKDGSIRRVEEFGHRVFVPGVGPVFYVFFLDNDTKYKIYDIDALTGLPGKTRFLQHASMTMAMASLDPESPKLAFIYIISTISVSTIFGTAARREISSSLKWQRCCRKISPIISFPALPMTISSFWRPCLPWRP